MDREEEIYSIILMYLDVAKKHNRCSKVFIRRKNCSKHKYWKYFEQIYKLYNSGEIFLPAYFEAQFNSPRWGEHDILPHQLTCKLALEIWSMVKNTYQNNSDQYVDPVDLVLERIKMDCNDISFISNFINEDKSFNSQKYYNHLLIRHYYLLRIKEKDWVEKRKTFFNFELEKMKSHCDEIEDLKDDESVDKNMVDLRIKKIKENFNIFYQAIYGIGLLIFPKKNERKDENVG